MSSVPAEARTPSKFEVILETRALCAYTMKILSNNNHFKVRPSGNAEEDAKYPPQPEVVGKMCDLMLGIYTAVYSANEIKLNENYKLRRQLQDKAIAGCNELLALAELSIPMFHIERKRFGYWGSKIVYVRNKIRAWKRSDYDRHRRDTG